MYILQISYHGAFNTDSSHCQLHAVPGVRLCNSAIHEQWLGQDTTHGLDAVGKIPMQYELHTGSRQLHRVMRFKMYYNFFLQ